MKDLEKRADVIVLVDNFYKKVLANESLKPIFAPSLANWEHHVVRVYDFWDNWLFQTGLYTGGMMFAHLERHKTNPILTQHFEQWLAFWFLSIDELFVGKNADFLKSKALEIGQILNIKLNGSV
jgi:hemoglobin